MDPTARLEYRKRTKEAATHGILVQECNKIMEGPDVLDIEMITAVFKEIALQTFPLKGPERKDWFRDDEDTLLLLVEEINLAEQCHRSEKSLKRTDFRKALKRAIPEAKEKWLEK